MKAIARLTTEEKEEINDQYELAKISGLLHTNLLTIVSCARSNAERRKGDAKICTITFEDLLEYWKQQCGLCFYSGHVMSLIKKTHFRMSLERQSQSLGYTVENCVLCS